MTSGRRWGFPSLSSQTYLLGRQLHGSIFSWMFPPADFPGCDRIHRELCPAGIPGPKQPGPGLPHCWALHCSLTGLWVGSPVALRGGAWWWCLELGCGRLCLIWALPCNTSASPAPDLYRNLGTADVYNPAALGLERALRSPTALNSARCCRLLAFSKIAF